jgi:hypothetical protein
MSQPHPLSPLKTGGAQTARSLLVAISIATGMLFAPLAQAAVVYNPATIVDHGTYITDTANHQDWYKFSNAVNTIGWSVNAWMGANGQTGWSMASEAQVQGLEGQFGWLDDTKNVSLDDNFGLTEAMADYLGHTGIFYTFGANTVETRLIQAVTSDVYFAWDVATQDYTSEKRGITTSQFYTMEDVDHQFYYWGDYVDGAYKLQGLAEQDGFTGIWLTRPSAEGGGDPAGDCGRTAPCPSVDVSEPSSGTLLMFGLVVLGTLRRTRYATLPRK